MTIKTNPYSLFKRDALYVITDPHSISTIHGMLAIRPADLGPGKLDSIQQCIVTFIGDTGSTGSRATEIYAVSFAGRSLLGVEGDYAFSDEMHFHGQLKKILEAHQPLENPPIKKGS